MEHSNPILMGNSSPQKFITIGEVMLRLTPPNYTEDLQTQQRMYLREESQPSRAALQHWQLVQVQRQLHIQFRTLHLQETTS